MAIWSLSRPYGTSTAGSPTNAGSQYRSRRRGRTHVCTHTRSRATADTGGGRDNVQGGSENRYPVGKGRQADVNPHAGWSPSVPGDRGSRLARGDPAAALGVGPGRFPGAMRDRTAAKARGERAGGGQREGTKVGSTAGGSAPVAMRRVGA